MSLTTNIAITEANINSYLPLATNAVLSTEQVLASAPSQTKLTTALALILNSSKIGEQVPVPSVQAISGLLDLVTSIVSSFNAAGLFNHKTTVPAPVPSGSVSSPTVMSAPVTVAQTVVSIPPSEAPTVAAPASMPVKLPNIFERIIEHNKGVAK